MDSARRFLIVRLSSLGDVIHALPLACAIKRQWRDAFVAWVVEEPFAGVLRDHPAVDRVITLPRGWLRKPGELGKLRAKLKEEKFGAAIDPQGLFKSAVAVRLSGAARRVGFVRPNARECAWLAYTDRVTPAARHVVDMNLELLKPLGIANAEAAWNMPAWPEAQTKVDQWLAAHDVMPDRFVILNPGAGWASKRWPTRRFADLAKSLRDGYHFPSLATWYGAEERSWGEEIVVYAHSGTSITVGPRGPMVWGDPLVRLALPTSVAELGALCRRARLFVSGDTGPLHLAAAVGTPCVGLFGASSGERNGPYGPRCRVVQKTQLEGPARLRRNAGPEAMLAIRVVDVERACIELLGAPSPRDGLHGAPPPAPDNAKADSP